MSDTLAGTLYKKDAKQFEKMNELAKSFAANYCGLTIIRDAIFGIVSNYARKRDVPLEILRYPMHKDELWACTFPKRGTIFLCVNSELPLSKQIFAMAHELYHIHCYAEDMDAGILEEGSLLDSKTADETAASREDLEANAFAGLLLMPDTSIDEQMKLYGIVGSTISTEDILTLMDLYALPYKAVVLRLAESKKITEAQARKLLAIDSAYVQERIALTGKARQWQQNTGPELSFGSLLDNMEYNREHELLTESREKADEEILKQIQAYCLKQR